jgi:Flp pilus assembly protein TadG
MNALKNKRGAVLIYVTLMTIVMLLFIAFAINEAWLVYAKNLAQRSVDAAALSGTAGILKYNIDGSTDQIEARVSSFNASNTVLNQSAALTGRLGSGGDTQVVVYNPANNSISNPTSFREVNGVRVTKAYDIPLPFAPFDGGVSKSLSVTATAVLREKGTLPLVLFCTPSELPSACPAGGTFELLPGNRPQPGDKVAYTSYTITNSSETVLRNLVNNPDTIPCLIATMGEQIQVHNGQVPGAMKEIKKAFDRNKTTDLSSPTGVSWPVLLPVVYLSFSNSGADQQSFIARFAPVKITEVTDPGNLTGEPGEVPEKFKAIPGGSPSSDLCGPMLVR